MATETKEGRTAITWSPQYLRKAEFPDMDTGEKTAVIGRLRGHSVATRRLTQVGGVTHTHTHT